RFEPIAEQTWGDALRPFEPSIPSVTPDDPQALRWAMVFRDVMATQARVHLLLVLPLACELAATCAAPLVAVGGSDWRARQKRYRMTLWSRAGPTIPSSRFTGDVGRLVTLAARSASAGGIDFNRMTERRRESHLRDRPDGLDFRDVYQCRG